MCGCGFIRPWRTLEKISTLEEKIKTELTGLEHKTAAMAAEMHTFEDLDKLKAGFGAGASHYSPTFSRRST